MIDTLLAHYTALLDDLDERCKRAAKDIPEIPCKKFCFDCCKQLLSVSMMEAFYLNEGFKKLDRARRRELTKSAEKLHRQFETHDFLSYETSSDSLEEIARLRNTMVWDLKSKHISCPILAKDGTCTLYTNRNHDCRVHGMSFNLSTNEMIGCFRHPKIFNTQDRIEKFKQKAVPFDTLYREKSKLDSLLTVELGKSDGLKYCYYVTPIYMPLLKDYRQYDWPRFFEERLSGRSLEARGKKYCLVVDNDLPPAGKM